MTAVSAFPSAPSVTCDSANRSWGKSPSVRSSTVVRSAMVSAVPAIAALSSAALNVVKYGAKVPRRMPLSAL